MATDSFDTISRPALVPDAPRETIPGDELGFRHFSRHLARTITTAVPLEGFVIAVNGPWGSGKTTMLKLTEEYLKAEPEERRPVVLWFNPWWFSGEDLRVRFFREIGRNIGDRQTMGTVRNAFVGFSEAFSPTVTGIPGLSSLGISVGTIGQLAKDRKTLEKRRDELQEALIKADKRILIIVDDIDRLRPAEVREVFQVIKALADLKQLTYLLAFDRNFVAKALEDVGLSGDDYLQKIVQASFELPLAEPGSVHKLFFDRMNAVLEDLPQEEFDKDSEHWTNLFYEAFRYLLVTPRQVTLLANSVSLTYPAVVGEVNPGDFLAIEMLRLFDYPVYETIRQHQDYFVKPLAAASFGSAGNPLAQQELEDNRQFHNTWLENVGEGRRAVIKALVQRMFPKLSSVWGTMTVGSNPSHRQRLRICAEECFPVYFRLGVPSSELSASEMRELLSLARDPTSFGKRLITMAEDEP